MSIEHPVYALESRIYGESAGFRRGSRVFEQRLSSVSNEFRRGVAVTFIPDNDREREQSGPGRGTWSIFGLCCGRASNYDFGVITYVCLSGSCPRSRCLVNRFILSLEFSRNLLWSTDRRPIYASVSLAFLYLSSSSTYSLSSLLSLLRQKNFVRIL